MPIAILLFAGCSSRKGSIQMDDSKSIISYSNLLALEDCGEYTVAKIKNPWDTIRLMATYILVPDSVSVSEEINGISGTIIRTPLKNSIVYSNIHISLINELGGITAIKGVCDVPYITDSTTLAYIEKGEIIDCGINTSPVIEKIMSIRPDAILLSPNAIDGGHGKLANINVKLIETADYMERTPLGRAEWIKFFGRLYGEGEKSDSMFNRIEHEYLKLKSLASKSKNRPKILFDGVYGGVWSVPTSESVTGNFIIDAGGTNPFNSLSKSGSAQLSPEEVLYKGSDADIWLIRYFSDHTYTLSEWTKQYKSYNMFKPVKDGTVYGSNTLISGVFDDGAFHPQWILADMISIIHPEISGIETPKKYFHRLENR